MIIDIQRFITVMQLKSVTTAAKQLHITQPALSLSLKRLEKELKQTLFIHSGRQLIPTQEAESFYRTAIRIVELWEAAKENSQQHTLPSIRLGAYDNAALQLAHYVTKQLLQQTYHLEVVIDRSLPLLEDLSKGLIDICICVIENDIKIPTNAVLIHSFSEELLPVSKQLYTQALTTMPFILYPPGSFSRKSIDATFLKQGIKPYVIAQSTSPSFMKQLAVSGSGVTLLPNNFVQHELEEGILVKQNFPFKFERKVGIFLRKDGKLHRDDQLITDILSFFQ